MNYDGPSFYKKKESKEQENQAIETPLDRLKKDQSRREQLSRKIAGKQKSKKTTVGNHYFRSTQLPKSLQSRDGWKEERWDQEVMNKLQKRLEKEPEDFLLFADHLVEEVEDETTESNKKKIEETSAEAMQIKKMVEEIENTLDTAALVQKEIKPDFKKPNTGLHRTLSNIIAEDKDGFKN